MRVESPPPPPSSGVVGVVDDAPTPVLEDESSEEKSPVPEKVEGRAEPNIRIEDEDNDMYGWGHDEEGAMDAWAKATAFIKEVKEVRTMKGKNSGENNGYAFVTFKTKELASKAIEDLNNTEFKEKKVKVSTSQVKNRVFIGNIPKNWTKEDLEKVITKVGPGINSLDLVKDPQNSNRNRGFAFIVYHNYACAEYARQKTSNPKFRLDDNTPTVSLADSKGPDSSSNAQVKAFYVKNLPKDITQEKLKKLFKHHGEITKVVLPSARSGNDKNRIGFVHFAERSSAMNAIKDSEKYEIDGRVLECSLVKPPSEKLSDTGSTLKKPSLLPRYPLQTGYGLAGGAFGGVRAGYGAAGISQPLMYGGGSAPAMAMIPILSPDGRIAQVMC